MANQRTLYGNLSDTNTLVKMAVLGVVSFVLMLFEFQIPIFALFLKMDLSDIPVLLAGFSMGPLAAVVVAVVKNLLHAFITQTAFIGEIANFVTGILIAVPASLIYEHNNNKKGAIIGMIVGTITMAVGMSFFNYYVAVPLYQKLLKIPLEFIVSAGTKVTPLIVDLKTLTVYSILPFNILKGVFVTLITSVIYKKLSPWLHR